MVFFLLAPILLVIALAVRFAGASRPLNIVDYRRVRDAAALHRWAGNRLAVLPVAAVACGAVALQRPSLALPLVALFVVAVLALAVWIGHGAERFQSGAAGPGLPDDPAGGSSAREDRR